MGQQCSYAKNSVYSPPESPNGTHNVKAVSYNYNRAQTTLRELFGAIRTGLVVSEAEFNVLPPAIATTARIKFSLGSGSIDTVAETENQEDAADSAEATEENEADAEDGEEDEEQEQEKGPFVLVTTLNGPSWAQGLKMCLSVRPIVGPFAHRKLLLNWNDNTLRVEGSEVGELNPRTIPDSFEDETDFCKCCLLLACHTDSATRFNPILDENITTTDKQTEEEVSSSVIPLKMAAYHTLIANLDAIPQNARLPTKVYHLLYGSQGPVDITIRAWPNTHAMMFGETAKMRVKSGILFAEFVCLLRARFHLPSSYSIKLYHNHMPILYSDLVAAKHTVIDCFVVDRSEDLEGSMQGSYCSGLDETGGSEGDSVALVTSLVGYKTQNITANLDMKMSDFDCLLRQSFTLKDDSFLLISAEDDYTPQYCSYDNWKCVYSFAMPDTSFKAGLRRSIRRLSFSRRRSGLHRQLPQEQINAALLPHLDRVLQLLSSSLRHFPSNLDKSDFSMEQLYHTMPMYEKTLDQCNIHPYTVIQVFEVTGPSIPVTFRVISSRDQDTSLPASSSMTNRQNDTNKTDQSAAASSRTRLTNIMDINPDWPLSTFFRYVDAIVSPGSTVKRKRRLAMGEHSLENWEDKMDLTLGQLFSQWSPTWWPNDGEERKTLTIKDINPSEFLVIEKF